MGKKERFLKDKCGATSSHSIKGKNQVSSIGEKTDTSYEYRIHPFEKIMRKRREEKHTSL
jgi:hypothetical protein